MGALVLPPTCNISYAMRHCHRQWPAAARRGESSVGKVAEPNSRILRAARTALGRLLLFASQESSRSMFACGRNSCRGQLCLAEQSVTGSQGRRADDSWVAVTGH